MPGHFRGSLAGASKEHFAAWGRILYRVVEALCSGGICDEAHSESTDERCVVGW